MSRRRGLIGAAAGTAAAVAGAVLVADARVGAARRRAEQAISDFTPPAPDRAGFLRTPDGVPLWVEQNGPLDAPVTVVLVHGFCLDRDDMLFQRRAVIERYGEDIRVVVYDQRSHGRSGRSIPKGSTIDQLGADLLTVLNATAPAGPLVLIGHSMGGMTIMALADAHPELFGARVAAVGLISTASGKLGEITLGLPAALARAGGPAVPLLLQGARYNARFIERGRARVTDIAWVFVRKLAFGPDVDPALVEFVTRMIGATPVDVIADFYETLLAHDKLAALHVLQDLPVALICGEDDVVTSPDRTREMAEALPTAELLVVPKTGHQVLMERPDAVNPPLLRLVDEVLCDQQRQAS